MHYSQCIMQSNSTKGDGIMSKNASHTRLVHTVLAALFAALTYVGTVFIQFPIAIGYVNLGDCFVLLGGFLLGPVYGAAAGGIGAMLGDLTLGYAQYAPVTLLIKLAMPLIVAGFEHMAAGRSRGAKLALRIGGGALAEATMVVGYFLYEIVLYEFGGALVSVPFNAAQGAVNLLLALLLLPLLSRIRNKTVK